MLIPGGNAGVTPQYRAGLGAAVISSMVWAQMYVCIRTSQLTSPGHQNLCGEDSHSGCRLQVLTGSFHMGYTLPIMYAKTLETEP